MIRNKVMDSQKFPKPLALHAACGLLENKGIYIVGGRSSEDEWVTDLFFFDLKKIEL
jgi:hypothetical protein